MMTFTKESISEAINIIEQHPEIRKGRESQEYDLIFGGKKYPPILVLSEASKLLGGQDIFLSDFNNSTKRAFKNLEELGFEIQKKINRNIWIEKSLVKNRQDSQILPLFPLTH